MNPVEKVKTTIKAISKVLTSEYLKSIGATNLSVASERTIRFDVPATEQGVNRVKVTLQDNGDLRMRTYKVEELEDVPNITPESLQTALANIAGIKAA